MVPTQRFGGRPGASRGARRRSSKLPTGMGIKISYGQTAYGVWESRGPDPLGSPSPALIAASEPAMHSSPRLFSKVLRQAKDTQTPQSGLIMNSSSSSTSSATSSAASLRSLCFQAALTNSKPRIPKFLPKGQTVAASEAVSVDSVGFAPSISCM